MGNDDQADQTVPLSQEQRKELASEGSRALAAVDASANDDANKTMPISVEQRRELKAAGMAQLTENPAAPSARPGGSARIEVPFDDPHAASEIGVALENAPRPGRDDEFDGMAKTEALPDVSEPPPASPPALAPALAPAAAPSPTKFDIDVATRFKQDVSKASAAPLPPVPAPAVPASPDDLALPPTTIGGDVTVDREMAKTAFVDMEAELSDGTGMLKLMAVAVVVVGVAVIGLLLFR